LKGKLAVGLVVLCALAVTGFYDLGHFDHNDFQYGVTPVLMEHGRLYQDFSFDQTPLAAWLGFVLLKLVGARRLYIAQRVVSLLCVWKAAWIGVCICRKRARRKDLVTLLFVAAFVSLGPLVVIGGEIGNYSLGLVLLAAALWVFLERREWALAVGLLAGLAVSAKLSNVYFVAAFGALYLMGARRWRTLALFGVGALIGVGPILYYLLRATRVFWFENLTYHYLINIYRGVPFHIPLWPLAAVGVLVLIAAPFLWAEAWGIVALLVAAMVGLVTPAILFPQYWAPPDFLLVVLGCLVFARRLEAHSRVAAMIVGVALLVAGWRSVQMIDEARGQLRAGNYGVIAVRDLRERLAAVMGPIDARYPGCHGDLISAFATPAVGSGVGIARISSEGPFMMRLDPVLAQKAAWFRGYSDVSRALTPASLVMVGYDPGIGFETVMRNYAAGHGFRTVGVGEIMGKDVVLEVPGGCVGG